MVMYTDGPKEARDDQNNSFGLQGFPVLCSITRNTVLKESAMG